MAKPLLPSRDSIAEKIQKSYITPAILGSPISGPVCKL